MSSILTLSIETSCDETSVAVLECSENKIRTLSNLVSSQVKLHAKWGGVVPNLAAREHVKNIPGILTEALNKSGKKLSDIDLIAVVNGPGLIPALLVGLNFAKTLAYRLEKPLIGIHHIEGHIYANFIDGISNEEILLSEKKGIQNSNKTFPALALVVSGGHTQLIFMKDHLNYEIIGQTLDDAVGEAFDKVARILGLGYPGGPIVSKLAAQYSSKTNAYKIVLPRPMLKKKDFYFSFSGLKTAVLYETRKHSEILQDEKYISAVCHEFQQASIDVLISKTIKAAEQYSVKTVMLAGGVSANTELRKQLGEAIKNTLPTTNYSLPAIDLTGDNAAMIGAAANFRWQKMNTEEKNALLFEWKTLQANANLKMR